jgi:hypothetical protein
VAIGHKDAFSVATLRWPVVWSVEAKAPDADDDELIQYCGEKRYVFVTQDEAQRRNEYYVSEIARAGIGFIEVRFGKGSFDSKDRVYRQNMESICELVRHPVPFCAQMNGGGFRFVPLEARLWGKGHGRREEIT